MNYKHHLLGGLIVTCLVAFILFFNNYLSFNLQNCGYLLGICFIFSLLPDIDIGTSKIRKVLLVIAGGLLIYAFISHLSYLGIGIAIAIIFIQFLSHRGLAHSFIVGVLLSACLYLYFQDWIFPGIAMLNFVSHLVLDSKT